MLSVYPAFISGQTCLAISRALKAAGLSVGEAHSAGATVIRVVRQRGGGLVLCGPRLSDMTAQHLHRTLEEEALVVVLHREQDKAATGGEGPLRLAMPFSARELADQIHGLLKQEEARQRMRHRLRTPEEDDLIHRAKLLLSARLGIDEAEAHRLIQRLSMREGLRMVLAAQRIIDM
jgi:hypothetical protein